MDLTIKKDSPNYEDHIALLAKELKIKYPDVYIHIYKEGVTDMQKGAMDIFSIVEEEVEELPEDELPF